MIATNDWLIHSSARKFMHRHPDLVNEETALLEEFETQLKPLIVEPVQAIHKALGLDYFGIDLALDNNNNIIIFEANSNMNILYNTEATPNIWVKPVEKIIAAINNLIVSKLPHEKLR
jgi:YheC/D-like protein